MRTIALAQAIEDAIKNKPNGHANVEITIGTDGWYYPADAAYIIKDFGLIEASSTGNGGANPTNKSSTTLTTSNLPFNPKSLTPEARARLRKPMNMVQNAF
mmetsp:Transcript_31640/g.76554  ORF Transcript_31640/g.76554 Transcript_31640/m.76554 type:complete len:101 (+) Transcript_31640:517-819(+)